MTATTPAVSLREPETFAARHIGPRSANVAAMLELLGYENLDALIDAAVPRRIRMTQRLAIHPGKTEYDALRAIRQVASRNELYRSYLGMGYNDCITPAP